MKYYLLDYENVNSTGLDGVRDLGADSRIILFYTKNSSKIDLGMVNLLRDMKAELSIVEVHHGKQALDIQLASYLGYLIGTEPDDTEYYIISKDKGYRNVQSFWPERHIVLCRNLNSDSEIVDEPTEAKKSSSRSRSRNGRKSTAAKATESAEEPKAAMPAEESQATKPVEEPKAAEPAEEPKVSTKPAEEPKAAEPAAEPKLNAFAEAAAIAKAVVEAKKARNEAEDKKKAESKQKAPAKKKAAEKKAAAKKAEPKKAEPKKKATAKQKASDARAEANNEIQKILSKEGFPEEVVNSTASFVSKNIGKEGYKQKIYRGIIKENGQKQGLAIYRLIKDKVK